jgi:Protein of unknown function (DUF2933)
VTIHIGRNALTFIGLGALAAAGLAFIAGVSLITIFWFSLVLACPLMMLFMHGGHDKGAGQDKPVEPGAQNTPGG